MKAWNFLNQTYSRFFARAVALPLLAFPAVAIPEEVTLFDVDFNGPPHSLNETPEIGASIHHISRMRFGSPTVISEYGALKERPLLFRGRADYDQIGFQIAPGYANYRIEYEVETGNLKDSQFGFSIHLDTPQVRVFELHGGNNRSYRFPFPLPEEEKLNPQLWEDGKKSHYVIEVDIGGNEWRMWQDGIHLFTTPFNATRLESVRFTLSPVYLGAAEDLSVVAAFDNLKITANDDFQPGPPSSLTLDGTNSRGLEISWSAVTLGESYRIYRGETGEWGKTRLLGETSEASFLDATALYDQTYHYWVTTVRKNVESSTATHASGMRKRIPPSRLTLSQGTRTDGIFVSWMSGAPVSPTRILRSESNALESASLLTEVSGSFHLDTTAVAGRTYFYWIMPAWIGVPSEVSSSGSGHRGFPPLEDLVITLDETSGAHRLDWASFAGAGHYTVYRSDEARFGSAIVIGRVTETFFNDIPRAAGSEVYYWVIPGSAGTSDFAAIPGRKVTLPERPDLWGEDASGALVGQGIANTTGVGQSLTMVPRTKRSMSGKVGIGSFGPGGSTISLSAPAGKRHFKVSYQQGGNVTAAVTSGRLMTATGSEALPLQVIVAPRRLPGRSFTKLRSIPLPVRGTSLVPHVGGDLVVLRSSTQRR